MRLEAKQALRAWQTVVHVWLLIGVLPVFHDEVFLHTAGHQKVLMPPYALAGVQDPAEWERAGDGTAPLLFTPKEKRPWDPHSELAA